MAFYKIGLLTNDNSFNNLYFFILLYQIEEKNKNDNLFVKKIGFKVFSLQLNLSLIRSRKVYESFLFDILKVLFTNSL